jgi:uncharacterized membrane protein
MTATADPPQPFEFVLYPNQPPSDRALMLPVAVFFVVSTSIGVGFFLLGAWPVVGFLGLDTLALYLAFRWVRREARRTEMIRVDRNGFIVRQIDPGGQAREVRLEPYWTRIAIEDARGNNARLTISSHGRRYEIGRFLTLAEKQELKTALEAALRQFR